MTPVSQLKYRRLHWRGRRAAGHQRGTVGAAWVDRAGTHGPARGATSAHSCRPGQPQTAFQADDSGTVCTWHGFSLWLSLWNVVSTSRDCQIQGPSSLPSWGLQGIFSVPAWGTCGHYSVPSPGQACPTELGKSASLPAAPLASFCPPPTALQDEKWEATRLEVRFPYHDSRAMMRSP